MTRFLELFMARILNTHCINDARQKERLDSLIPEKCDEKYMILKLILQNSILLRMVGIRRDITLKPIL